MLAKIVQTTDYELIARLNAPVHDLHVSLYPQYFQDYNYDEMRDSFQNLMSNHAFMFLVMEQDDEPVGYAWIEMREYPENAFRKSYRSVYVHQISILKPYKRRGYGSLLMEHIYEIARSKGIQRVELDYWAQNEDAKAFYKRHGFSKYREFVYREV